VLIYVKDKAAAFGEFHRVLKPGGRISLFEPINRLMNVCDPDRFYGYDVRAVAAIAAKVQTLYDSFQPPDSDPMVDFDERDLVQRAEDAGLAEIDLDLQLKIRASKQPHPWERFLRTSGNPLVPTVGEAFERALSAGELARITAHLKPLVEAGIGQERRAVAYLTAVKS
jgi:SAM-dependent methyltransferase